MKNKSRDQPEKNAKGMYRIDRGRKLNDKEK